MSSVLANSSLTPALRKLEARCRGLGGGLYLSDGKGSIQPLFGEDLPGCDTLASQNTKQQLAARLTGEAVLCDQWIAIEPEMRAVPLRCGATFLIALFHAVDDNASVERVDTHRPLDVSPADSDASPAGVRRYSPEQLAVLGTALRWAVDDLHQLYEHEAASDDLTEQLGQSYETITMMFRLGRSMSSVKTPQLITQSICEQLCATQSFGWVATRFRDDEESVPELRGQSVIAGELNCDHVRFNREAEQLLDKINKDAWSKLLQVDRDPLATIAGSEIIVDPIQHDGRVVGLVMAGGKTGPDAEATSHDTQLVDAIASFLGTFHENSARFNEQRSMFIGTLEAVSAALDAKDRYTRGHSERVAYLGTMLARAIGLDEAEIDRIRIAGLVHDVGKIGVPEAVLCKAGRLTDDEFDKIKKHPRIGFNILKGIPRMEDVLDGVLYHHERWDGRGYPDRLAGENIPLYGRILAVCDTFDAMSSTRSYRKAMPREKVLEEILRCAGSQFDPQLTDPFVALSFDQYDEMVLRHQQMDDQEQTVAPVAA